MGVAQGDGAATRRLGDDLYQRVHVCRRADRATGQRRARPAAADVDVHLRRDGCARGIDGHVDGGAATAGRRRRHGAIAGGARREVVQAAAHELLHVRAARPQVKHHLRGARGGRGDVHAFVAERVRAACLHGRVVVDGDVVAAGILQPEAARRGV